MKIEFYLHFENGMPKGTAQQKGETIKYRRNQAGKVVPYIKHYRTDKVSAERGLFIYGMKRHAPKEPIEGPVKLAVFLFFDVKDRTLWGKYKPTRPDCDNYVKEIKDAMTASRFWNDDNQVVDLRVVKRYAEKATIYIRLEDPNDD
jgi:Holliday junction resolvase RusA-like endonuclease